MSFTSATANSAEAPSDPSALAFLRISTRKARGTRAGGKGLLSGLQSDSLVDRSLVVKIRQTTEYALLTLSLEIIPV
jgi:hypothetical protein